jgi:hypothetical protein
MSDQTNPNPDIVTAILVGEAQDEKKAEKLVRAAQTCPYVAMYEHKGCTVMGVFTLPRPSQQWIEYPKEQPFILGLEHVVTFITREVQASSPWSRGCLDANAEETPCKKDCAKCPQYKNGCQGCPATIFYYAAE